MKLNAYATQLLQRLGEREATPLSQCEGDALHRLEELGLVDIRLPRYRAPEQVVSLTWAGIVKLRQLRRWEPRA
jgi:hypothetical protein